MAGISNSTLKLDTEHRTLMNASSQEHSPKTDQDMSDEASNPRGANRDGAAEDSVIGVSIGRAQTYMKSPQTPAVEKTRALQDSAGYFDSQLGTVAAGGNAPSDSIEARLPAKGEAEGKKPTISKSTSQTQLVTPSPWQAHPPTRSSIVKTMLGDGSGSRRQRSSSGSAVFDSFKKMLPELPSVPNLKAISLLPGSVTNVMAAKASPPHKKDVDFTGPGKQPDKKDSQTTSDLMRQEPVRRTGVASTWDIQELPSRAELDGNAESLLTPSSPGSSRSRQRTNSDSSLYLQRKFSGLSAFDDTSAYADVREMANARFKAITDSFQNSTIRLPKLPTVKANTGFFTKDDSDSIDNLTVRNTQANRRAAAKEGPPHYTNLHNVHKSRKFIEIESTQQRAHPVLHDALSRTSGDLIIMGGYRGSVLRDAKPPHRQLWAPVKVGLNLRKSDLEVGLTREDEERAHEKVIPAGILSHIGPIDICRRLLKHARKCLNARANQLRIHDWGYDWRLSPELLCQRLIKFLEDLECNHPETPPEKRGAIVIAHSLGGLLTRHAVNCRPELFAGVLYAGVPQNCVNILGPLRHGDDVLLSSRVLTAQVNFTMRTSFALLPEDGRCFIQKHTNERYDLDFFDPQTWEDYSLSPCISSSPPPNTREHRKSIIGSISESITSSLPSVPGKRGSWFGGTSQESSTTNNDRARSAAPANGAAQDAVDNLALTDSPENKLEPSMKQPAHKSSIATQSTIPLPVAREYLAHTLREVLAFKRALAHRPELQSANKYPPNAIIFGKTVPTVYGARVANREAIKYSNAFDDLAFAAGDGVVLASAAQLPEGYRCVKGGRMESDRGHVGLLGDLEGVGKCLAALVEARSKGVGLGDSVAE